MRAAEEPPRPKPNPSEDGQRPLTRDDFLKALKKIKKQPPPKLKRKR